MYKLIVGVLFCVAAVSAAPKPGFPLVDTVSHISTDHVAAPVVSTFTSPVVSSVVAPAVSSVIDPVGPVVRTYNHFAAPIAYSGYPSYNPVAYSGAYDYHGYGYPGFY